MHTWHYTKQIVAAVGTPIEIDMATKTMNRPSMAKIRVEIDLMKPLIHNVWIGTEDDNEPLKGYVQKIEYENIPKYCKHCKKLGHNLMECRVLERKKENEKKEVERMKQHTNPKEDVLKTDGKENGPNGKNEVQNRGRDQRSLPDQFRNRPRGKSEPPKVFKPTGAVFGIDKPMPISGKKQNEKNAEKGMSAEHQLGGMEQRNQDDSIREETKEQLDQNKESLQKEIESQGIPKEKVDSLDNTGKDQQEDQPMRQTVLINNPNELTVDLFEGKWLEFGNKKSKSRSGKKGRSPRQKGSNEKDSIMITQNSFDELMQEDENFSDNKNEGDTSKTTEERINAKETNIDENDEWADKESSEEENTSDSSEDMESESDEEEESDSEQEEQQKQIEKRDMPAKNNKFSMKEQSGEKEVNQNVPPKTRRQMKKSQDHSKRILNDQDS
ncbi:eukaryotic translation initiation factor 5B-like [Lycium ferocissimum]|uniref:eukaryotic translation initiation factor 5B-like n=1 Tax=Lycium ferocissimum TaxID=112874 RepID=UPI002815FD21|nr:eukaryotic translation initiation factor 5B-like [Lycium ferocissimum]